MTEQEKEIENLEKIKSLLSEIKELKEEIFGQQRSGMENQISRTGRSCFTR